MISARLHCSNVYLQLKLAPSVVDEEEQLLLRRTINNALRSRCKITVVRAAETLTQLAQCTQCRNDENAEWLVDTV